MNPSAEGVAPLLIELARAVRAYQFFEPGHATRAHALAKAVALWTTRLPQLGELELEIQDTGFYLGGVAPIPAAALGDLANALCEHRVLALQIHPELSENELGSLVDSLAREPKAHGPGGLAGTLKDAGVRHVAVWSVPEPAKRFPGVDTETELPPTRPAIDSFPLSEDVAGGAAVGTAEEIGTVTEVGEAPAPEAEAPAGEGARLPEVDELDACTDVGEYRVCANRVDSALDHLLAAREFEDAYAITRVFSRHAGDPGRAPVLRNEARARLRAVFRNDGLMGLVVGRALDPDAKDSVEAVHMLSWLAPQSVIRVLDEHSKGDHETRNQATAVLLTMGDQALPTLVDELGDESPARARRAARILGDMQNPTAVEFLADHLRHPDAGTQREVTLALARIGSPRSVQVLAEALAGPPELAVVAAGGLGNCRSREAVRELGEALGEKSGHGEAVRREAMRSLGRIGDPESLPALKGVLDRGSLLARKKNRPLRIAAAQAIAKIGGEAAYLALEPHASGGDAALQKTCRELMSDMERRGDR